MPQLINTRNIIKLLRALAKQFPQSIRLSDEEQIKYALREERTPSASFFCTGQISIRRLWNE